MKKTVARVSIPTFKKRVPSTNKHAHEVPGGHVEGAKSLERSRSSGEKSHP